MSNLIIQIFEWERLIATFLYLLLYGIQLGSINENTFIDQFFSFSVGKAIFHFYTNKITISVPVTNKEGVEY